MIYRQKQGKNILLNKALRYEKNSINDYDSIAFICDGHRKAMG